MPADLEERRDRAEGLEIYLRKALMRLNWLQEQEQDDVTSEPTENAARVAALGSANNGIDAALNHAGRYIEQVEDALEDDA